MAMSTVSVSHRDDGVAVITLTHPPVNALSSTVQRALSSKLRSTLSIGGLRGVVIASGVPGFFSGGADVSEFEAITEASSPFDSESSWTFQAAEVASIPIVAAVAGACFGGGFELALSCSARVATPDASFALPELKLGIIPGLGGTQRLPRLVGFETAVQMMLYSTVVSGTKAETMGIVDYLVADPDAIVDAAAKVALEICSGARLRTNAIDRSDRIGSLSKCRAAAKRLMESDVKKLSRGGALPQYAAAVRCALAGVERGGRKGLDFEKDEFASLVTSNTSKAIVHMFFATRNTSKIQFPNDPEPSYVGKPPQYVAVIGGGLMGAGIATSLLQAGINVIIKEVSDDFATAARSRVKRNLGSSQQSKLSQLETTSKYDLLANVDMVIEAALEDPRLKQNIFKTLESTCRSDCILATNTSTINIDLIGMGCPRAHAAGRVLGAHFFSPAHKMPLLEVVRTEATSAKVLKDVISLGKKMKKTPVVVGNCTGFAVNRMYFPQGMVANFLVTRLDQDPYRVDAACEKFGLPLGPFKLVDLVGLDVAAAVGDVFAMSFADRAYTCSILRDMERSGLKGQKSGAGFYKYSGSSRIGVPNTADVQKFIEQVRISSSSDCALPVNRLKDSNLSDGDIVEMILLPCVNEACRILDEKVALRRSDLDVCSVMGMAFPAHYGGLMKWAETTFGTPQKIIDKLNHFYSISGNACPLFIPSHALTRMARYGTALGVCRRPVRQLGGPDDIVVVGAVRTAVGRASRGGFKDTLPDDLLRPLLEEILDRTKVSPGDVDDVVIGTVLTRGDTGVVQTRVASILSGLPCTVPVKTVDRLCSSGLQAIVDAAASIQVGHYKIAIAGGLESMSFASMQNKELKPNPLSKLNDDALHCYLSMGETSENVASKYGISRERQDRMAVTSHARASSAKLAKRQADEIVSVKTKVKVIDRETKKVVEEKEIAVAEDEGVRIGVRMEHLAKLPAVFKKHGSTTPGNSSQLSDGAAVVMMMKRSEALARGLTPLASLRSFAVVGVDPALMGIGPITAIPRCLEKCGLRLEDIDLFEVNEAFGSQADYCIEALKLNRDIVNVMGGAIAIGHPLGMTGARLSVSIIHELHRRGGRFGLVSMCVGTGMGAAAVYEINSNDGSPTAKL